MRRFFVPLAAVAILAAGLVLATSAPAAPAKLFAALTGAAECNAAGTCGLGDPDGAGTAELTATLRPHSRICWSIDVTNITLPPTGVHIHRAPVGVAGPIVVDFMGQLSGCTNVAPTLLSEIIHHPERFYVNVHNADFPAGAIRGQLTGTP